MEKEDFSAGSVKAGKREVALESAASRELVGLNVSLSVYNNEMRSRAQVKSRLRE